jgi:hypothetical protein
VWDYYNSSNKIGSWWYCKTAATEINIKEFIVENKRDRIMCLDEVNLNKFKNISSCNR